jgi:hypothetical protein
LLGVLTFGRDMLTARSARADRERRQAVKHLLGVRMEEATALIYSQGLTQKEVSRWFSSTCDLIEAALGRGEKNVFHHHMPSEHVVTLMRRASSPGAATLHVHAEGLGRLIERLDALTVRDDFDPDLWKLE